jgi:hypothetical protein
MKTPNRLASLQSENLQTKDSARLGELCAIRSSEPSRPLTKQWWLPLQ